MLLGWPRQPVLGHDGGVPTPGWKLRLIVMAFAYVMAVATVATLGFTEGSTLMILIAALVTLPSSVIAVLAYYVAFGLLAQVPGANPGGSAGSGSCSANGICRGSTTGDPAAWFTHTTEVIEVLALTAAAVLNVALVVAARVASRRNRAQPIEPARGSHS